MEDPFLFRHQNAAELWLIRHGDAIPGPDEIIPSGVYDDLPLSSIGREQAQALAERLDDMPVDAIYSSPLKRCQQTAAPLAERLSLIPIIVSDIKEIRIGEIRPLPTDLNDLPALTKALQERQIDIVRIAGAEGNWDAIENSERSKDFRGRVVTAIDDIAAKHSGQRVLVFAHGGVINAYAADVLGLEREFFFPCANTSITIVRVAGPRRILYVMNDVAHVRRHF
ncbi:MAG TPA: histidine phosphatase family protein [Ktedonobacteraceae bacterium]|nr:histidine phosphatase family protein [Ktedonobacteraceae bacterium]